MLLREIFILPDCLSYDFKINTSCQSSNPLFDYEVKKQIKIKCWSMESMEEPPHGGALLQLTCVHVIHMI